jgi:sugar lactone lactonase YvrE
MSERTVLEDLYFPEALRWRDGALWFTDQYGGDIIRVHDGEVRHVATVPGRPGGLGWNPDGDTLVVSMAERSVYSVGFDGTLRLHADLSNLLPAMANDMLVDPQGRAYVGNYGYDVDNGQPPRTTHLVRVDSDGSICVEDPELLFPNGTVLVDDGSTLLVAETFADRVTAMSVAVDGSLSSPRVVATFPSGSGPDGIAVDHLGRIWVACAFSSRAVAVNRAGEIVDEVRVPGEGVYCPEVGGSDGTTLFLGIAALDEEQAAREPTGRIVAIDL